MMISTPSPFKRCSKCGEEKLRSEFYRHSRTKDGLFGKCKECTKRDVRANRLARLEYYRAYDRARGSRRTLEETQEWRRQNPEKYRAHVALNNAVRDGIVIKPSECERCGGTRGIHGHHYDYSKPLDVEWLCAACHHIGHAHARESRGSPGLAVEPKPHAQT